jgi:amino acid adenylation domain-containing protein/non-ribosomal peptide synthase protein (TIGR01720 family)
MPFAISNLVSLLQKRVQENPEGPAYIFLSGKDFQQSTLTYSRLDAQARAIAGLLQTVAERGERALLLYPPGLDFIAAFFGCLYAGMIAVPAYPPRLNRNALRITAIAEDSEAKLALSTAAVVGRLESLKAHTPGLGKMQWFATDQLPDRMAESWRAGPVETDEVAYLQYTSGSTATPRGVMITHANVLHNSGYLAKAFGHSREDRSLNWLPHFHDLGLVHGILQPLYSGFAGYLMAPMSFLQRPLDWLRAISQFHITHSDAPNFAYELCATKIGEEEKAGLDLSSWIMALNGAEPVFPETMDRFAAAFAHYGFARDAFYPAYGLAEATLVVSGARKKTAAACCCVQADALQRNQIIFARTDQPGTRVLSASGMFGPGMDVEIVDPESSRRCPGNEIGEIWVSGPSIALGYWKRVEETEQTFAARLADGDERRFLRTGDLGFVHEGHLYITGRLKELIIVRGRNYYPQDIERTARESCPSIQLGTGAAFSISAGAEERLVLVQEISRHAQVAAEDVFASIRAAIAEEHEIQAHEIVLVKAGAVPKTSSGKIQRRLCRADFLQGNLEIVNRWRAPTDRSHDEAGDLPRTAEHIQKWLAHEVAAAIGVQEDRIDAERPLSRFGLDSIRAIELALAVEKKLGITWNAATFLEDKTIAGLAEDALEAIATHQESKREFSAPGRATEYPLSYGQQGLWFLHQLVPDSTAYNIVQAIRLRSGIDVSALKTAFQMLVNRHGSLRTTFAMAEGKPFQRVRENAAISFVQEDAREWSDEQLQERLSAEANYRFDLERGPVFRVHLFTRPQNEHILLITAHHIILDLWSLAQMMHELGLFYAAEISGRAAELLPPVREYSEFVHWQRNMLASEHGEEMWAYWSRQLAGEFPALNLPLDRLRPPAQTYSGDCYWFKSGAELSSKLKNLGQDHGATLYLVLLAAFGILLHKYTREEDVIIGTPFAGRTRAGFAATIGYFVNPVALRISVSAATTFETFLAELRKTALGALQHGDYPFSQLVDRLGVVRDPGRPPLFQVMFAMQKAHLLHGEGLSLFALGEPGARMNLGGLELESLVSPQRIAQFDLTLMVAEAGDGLAAGFEYNTDRFGPETIHRMARHFLNLLQSIVSGPAQPVSSLSLLAQPECRRIIEGFNPAPLEFPDFTLHELFEEQAARKPDAVALIYEERQLSYQELNECANQVAHYLRGAGVKRGSRVGLCLERSIESIACMLGILKAGAAYVPLDQKSPNARLAFLLQDAGVEVLLTKNALLQPLPESRARYICIESEAAAILCQETGNPSSHTSADDVAYIVYTSGSTGRPKGVAVAHGAAGNHMQWIMRELPLGESGRMLHKHSSSFDASLAEILHPLLSGATVVIAPPGAEHDPGALIQIMRKQQVTAIDVVPAMLKVLIGEDEITKCAGLKLIISGGEALTVELQQTVHERLNWVHVINAYGPTEAAITAAFHRCSPSEKAPAVPIGRPISNTQIYILDQALQPVPIGVAGEIHIGGRGLAHGYLNELSMTAEKFIPDPFSGKAGARLYKTGDLGRYLPDGSIQYLRRADRQVKVRGFRIELGEIEVELKKYAAVDDAVVIARSRAGESNQILAYVTSRQGITPALLRSHLKATLPEHMLPAGIMVLERFPFLPSGKLDFEALPQPEQSNPQAGSAPPQSKVEKELVRIWQDVLRRNNIGVHDNFFELGGDSILAIQVVARARNAGLEIAPAQVVRFQTVASLAAVAKRPIERFAPPVPRDGPAPLTPIQRWFFEQELPERHHYNQAVMLEVKRALKPEVLEKAFHALRANHAAVRMRFQRTEQGWRQTGAALVDHQVLRRVFLPGSKESHAREIEIAASEAQSSLNLETGDLMRAVYFDAGAGSPHRLLIVIHHLAVDGVSWSILLENLQKSYEQLERGDEASPPQERLSFGQWSELLFQQAQTETTLQELSYWTSQAQRTIKPLPRDFDGENTAASTGVYSIALGPEDTEKLLQRTAHAYHTQTNDILLAALGHALADWAETDTVCIDLEGHGREEILPGADLSNTVGWLTTIFPLVLELKQLAPGETVRSVKEQLRQVPRKGIGYGLLRYFSSEPMKLHSQAEISFNYLGQWDRICAASSLFSLSDVPAGPMRSNRGRRSHLIEIDAYIKNGCLQVQWAYSRNVHDQRSIAEAAGSFMHRLSSLIEHCASRTGSEHTPSDFPLVKLTERQLERLRKSYGRIADIYPLSPIQQGMLFHSLLEPSAGTYLTQFVCELTGDLNQEAFCAAWRHVVNTQSSLKACFEAEIVSDEPVQVIADSVDPHFQYGDWSDAAGVKRKNKLREFLEQDRERGIDLKAAPLMRFALFKAGPASHTFIWSSHHLLMDGWSLPIILKDVFAAYEQVRCGLPMRTRPEHPYKDYINWLRARDLSDAEAFWRHLLAGFASPVSLRNLQSTVTTRKTEEFTEQETRLAPKATELLQTVAREHQLTLSALVHAAWALLLSNYTGSPDVVFGMVVSGRPAEIADVESMVGVFINTLPLRVRISGEAGLVPWINELQMQQAEVSQHGHVPLAQVQAWSELPRRSRLFESILVFENYPNIDAACWLEGQRDGIQISNVRALERSNYPITLWVLPGREISLKVGYNASHLDSVKMAELLHDYRALLEEMAANPRRKAAEVLEAVTRARQNSSGEARNNESQDAPTYSASVE